MSAVSNFQLATYAEQMREQRDEARCALAEAQELIAALEARNADLEGRDARQRSRIADLEEQLRANDPSAIFTGKTVDAWLS